MLGTIFGIDIGGHFRSFNDDYGGCVVDIVLEEGIEK